MNLKEIPWWLVCGLVVLLLIWKTAWMGILGWLASVAFVFAIIAGVVVIGFVLVSLVLLPWTSRSKMCDPRVSLKQWQKIQAEKKGGGGK